MADQTFPIRLAQTLGLTTQGIVAGLSLSYSIIAVPRLLESPTPLMLKQWAAMYNTGKLFMPPLSLLSASTFFYLASQFRNVPSALAAQKYWMFIAAGFLAGAQVPYTVLLMKGTNGSLMQKEKEVRNLKSGDKIVEIGLGEKESAHELVDWWAVLNLGRCAFLTAGFVVATWNVVN
ncbi:hypothetical protein HYALB_00011405 [Hymenoscyphus albidus]|uniref:DUF1772-domain-containing protein n=1 Tax=Hymenoscyphus albidus TaxID=595503 RepID=A0A9N9PY93_9HELO|nr:hypothetical protein HYALB_00011405 [Hymenoscyphus albidus]